MQNNRKTIIENSKIIVIKVGTNILTTPCGQLDLNNLRQIANQISQIIKNNKQVILVTSGAITCGSERLQISANSVPEKQAAASVGQILLMSEYLNFFSHKSIQAGQILLTKDGLEKATIKKNVTNTIKMLLKHNILPIINENDSIATNEIQNHRFGDNDELSFLVAKLVQADLLITLTDIDGLFTANPKQTPDAKLISDIERVTDDLLSRVEDIPNTRSRGGMKSKLTYAKNASELGIHVIIANGRRPTILDQIFSGESVGTFIKG